MQISDANFAKFIETMASVLEDIERRQAGSATMPIRTAPIQLELPLVAPPPTANGQTVGQFKRQQAA
ncbi:MAG: hypothetical protein ABL907_22770 [Hyphomicrobium sp.]